MRPVEAFFALVRGGMWEAPVSLEAMGERDWNGVLQLMQKQAVAGLVGAGMAHLVGERPPKAFRNFVVSTVYSMEQRNQQMNAFLEKQGEDFETMGAHPLLIKGQGVAQCYERPLLRASGDIDYLSTGEDFERLAQYLLERSDSRDEQTIGSSHQVLILGDFEVELHGNINMGLGERWDRILGEKQQREFSQGQYRMWGKQRLPSYQFDVIQVFTHILKHFYKGGIGLRQVCDWCRLLYVGSAEIDHQVLRQDLEELQIMQEWQAFGCFAADYLGMPTEKIPFYTSKFHQKGRLIADYILEVGNFGHHRIGNHSVAKTYIGRKLQTFCLRIKDYVHHVRIFPLNSVRFFLGMTKRGLKFVLAGR